MDKAERGELLRKRFKAKGGFPFISRRHSKPTNEPKRGGFFLIHFGKSNDERQPDWLKMPDAKPNPVPRPKRNQGETAITKISRKAPKKLVRAYRNAEELLSAVVNNMGKIPS